MADIKVERKGASVWPWILGLLVAALLIWALMGLFGDQDEVQLIEPASEVGPNPETGPPIDNAAPGGPAPEAPAGGANADVEAPAAY